PRALCHTLPAPGAHPLSLPDALPIYARAAGVNVEGLRYTVPVSTANGQGLAARTRLDSIEVGGIVRRNLTAFVTEEGALETSLQDRKSTRLNSSHVKISYAGFCLKKK